MTSPFATLPLAPVQRSRPTTTPTSSHDHAPHRTWTWTPIDPANTHLRWVRRPAGVLDCVDPAPLVDPSPLCVRRAGVELVAAAAATTFDSPLTTAPVLAAAPRTPAVAPAATDKSTLTLLVSAAPLAQRALVVGCTLVSIGCLPVAAPVAAVLFVLIGFLVDAAVRATPTMPDAALSTAADTSTSCNELAMVVYDAAQASRRTANVPDACYSRASGATISSPAPTVSTAATAAVSDANTVPAAGKVIDPVLLTLAVSVTAARTVPAATGKASASAAAVTSASCTDLAMVVYDAHRAARTVLAAVEKYLLFASAQQQLGLAPQTLVHRLLLDYRRSVKLHTTTAAFAATTDQLPVIVVHPAVREANADGDADKTDANATITTTTTTTTSVASTLSDGDAGLAVVVYDAYQGAMHMATTTDEPAAATDNAQPASHIHDSLDRVADNAAPTHAPSLDDDQQPSVQVPQVPARHTRTRLQNRLQIQQLTPITANRDVELSELSASATASSSTRQPNIKAGVLHPRANKSSAAPRTSPSPKAPGSSSSSIAVADVADTAPTAVAATDSPDASATSRRTKRWNVASRLFDYLKEPWYLTHRAECKERRAKHESANSSRRTSTSATDRR